MDSPDRRRRRKRLLRQPSWVLGRVRLMGYCSLCFLSILWCATHLGVSSFHPVLRVPRLSLPSSSSSTAVESVDDLGSFRSVLKIENTVLFPDSVLLVIGGGGGRGASSGEKLVCVYSSGIEKDVVSFDEYDGFRWAVRCPIENSNSNSTVTSSVGLKWKSKEERLPDTRNRTSDSWGYLVYASVVDGDDVVVFVKGLNLRSDRKSDPSFFSCHFEVANWERTGDDPKTIAATKASMAAQEVVRCPLPKTLISDLDENYASITVTVSVKPPRSAKPIIMPSVAAISRRRTVTNQKKHELCMCTMVWNQASSIKEWILYHSWLGVQRWFIYDNNSDDGIDSILEELNQENYNITRHFWPWIKTQEAGFSHCALRAREECNWVSFMDVDEYFYFPYSSSSRHKYRPVGYASQGSLLSLVSNFTSTPVAEIRTSCYSFGPSGRTSQPEQGVTTGYTCRLQNPERHKSIVRPDALDPSLLNIVHHFHLKEGFKYFDLPRSAAVINHYKYQVWEAFRAKFHRRVATYVADWQENQNEGSRDRAPGLGTEAVEPADWSRRFCEVWDTGLRDLIIANFADSSTGLLPWGKSSASSA